MRLIAKKKLEKLKRKNKGNTKLSLAIDDLVNEIEIDDESEATVVWTGTHQEYETIFKNNKNTIKKWLRANEYID
jgi:hypothetical protein